MLYERDVNTGYGQAVGGRVANGRCAWKVRAVAEDTVTGASAEPETDSNTTCEVELLPTWDEAIDAIMREYADAWRELARG